MLPMNTVLSVRVERNEVGRTAQPPHSVGEHVAGGLTCQGHSVNKTELLDGYNRIATNLLNIKYLPRDPTWRMK